MGNWSLDTPLIDGRRVRIHQAPRFKSTAVCGFPATAPVWSSGRWSGCHGCLAVQAKKVFPVGVGQRRGWRWINRQSFHAPLRLSFVVQQLGWLGEIVQRRLADGGRRRLAGSGANHPDFGSRNKPPFLSRVPRPSPGSRSRCRSDAGTASHSNYVSLGG